MHNLMFGGFFPAAYSMMGSISGRLKIAWERRASMKEVMSAILGACTCIAGYVMSTDQRHLCKRDQPLRLLPDSGATSICLSRASARAQFHSSQQSSHLRASSLGLSAVKRSVHWAAIGSACASCLHLSPQSDASTRSILFG